MRGGDQVRAAASARQVEGGRRCPRFEAHRACSDIVAQSRERQHSRRHLPGRQASRLCGGPPRCSAVARLSWSQKTRERATSAHRQPPCTHTTHTYTRASTKTEVLTRQVTWFPLAPPPLSGNMPWPAAASPRASRGGKVCTLRSRIGPSPSSAVGGVRTLGCRGAGAWSRERAEKAVGTTSAMTFWRSFGGVFGRGVSALRRGAWCVARSVRCGLTPSVVLAGQPCVAGLALLGRLRPRSR